MARTHKGRPGSKVVGVKKPKTARQRQGEAVAAAVEKFGQDRVRQFLKEHGTDSVHFLLSRRTLWGASRVARRAARKAAKKK